MDDDAHLLMARLHRKALLVCNKAAADSFNGLDVAGKALELGPHWRRKLRIWDACIGLIEKLSQESIEAHVHQLSLAIATAKTGSTGVAEVHEPVGAQPAAGQPAAVKRTAPATGRSLGRHTSDPEKEHPAAVTRGDDVLGTLQEGLKEPEEAARLDIDHQGLAKLEACRREAAHEAAALAAKLDAVNQQMARMEARLSVAEAEITRSDRDRQDQLCMLESKVDKEVYERSRQLQMSMLELKVDKVAWDAQHVALAGAVSETSGDISNLHGLLAAMKDDGVTQRHEVDELRCTVRAMQFFAQCRSGGAGEGG
mmetsp:Transcript_102899/g.204239  ORF Transcript_102899/g.204239 Transcript_102899/m.204239 type:complete len:312 (+) Transcript_102899:99-1034(+)